MAIPRITRRPSLLYDDELNQQPENPLLQLPIHKEDATNKLKSQRLLSIDDLDMISLGTKFDQQMLLGSPMYLDPEEEEMIDPVPMESGSLSLTNHATVNEVPCGKPIPSEAPNFYLDAIGDTKNPITKLIDIRSRYVIGSYQDNASNIKNKSDSWFVYPKPLPKFWKFEKDNRLKDDQEDSDVVDEKNEKAHKVGCYAPHFSDESDVIKEKAKVHYTGEHFDFDHFKKEYARHILKLKKSYKLSNTPRDIPSFQQFKGDFNFVVNLIDSHKISEISQKRLQYLLDKFDLFQHLKSKSEILENKQVPYRDFYNCRKVDRDFRLSGCVSQRQLSEFIWEKLNLEPERKIYKTANGQVLTLSDIFELGKTPDEPVAIGLKLIDDEFLDWYKEVYLTTYHIIRLPDEVIEKHLTGKNLRYYMIARTFLEFDNLMEGEYFAQILIRYVFHFLEKSKYQLAQISVNFQFYPMSDENNWWIKFSEWLMKWKLISYNIRWNVEFPRCFSKMYNFKMIKTFQDYLDIIFTPLYENQYNDTLQFFLSNVCAFDLVIRQYDDYIWKEFTDIDTPPNNWSAQGDNPTISHYMYYIFTYLADFNQLRYQNYQNCIVFRSSCSPGFLNRTSQFCSDSVSFTEQVESLICNLLLCNGGLLQGEPLWGSSPTLEYLFYLFQIPIITAPLSSVSARADISQSNADESILFANDDELFGFEKKKSTRDITMGEQFTYPTNPFMKLMKIGFKVSISSKSVLYNSSYTMEPLIEEYSVAASIYLLNAADLCELSRNSVLCSGYDGFYKAHWIGVTIQEPNIPTALDPVGIIDIWHDNAEDTRIKHNVPLIRREYRSKTLNQEWEFINDRFL